MKTQFVLPLLLLSAVAISPAHANWFSNPQQGISRNIGSAPNPRPEDIPGDIQPVAAQNPDTPTSAGMLTITAEKKPAETAPAAAAQAPADAGKDTADASPSR